MRPGPRTSSASSRGARARFGRPPVGTRAASISIPRSRRTSRGSARWRGLGEHRARDRALLGRRRPVPVRGVRRRARRSVRDERAPGAGGGPGGRGPGDARPRRRERRERRPGARALRCRPRRRRSLARGPRSAEWSRRRSVHVADALAWALYANGRFDEAARYADRALGLGTRNALFLFHAGMIERALGHDRRARGLLRRGAGDEPQLLDPARLHGGPRPRRARGRCDDPLLPRALAVAVGGAARPGTSMAHPLGNFTVNRYAGIVAGPRTGPGRLRGRHGGDPDGAGPPGGRRRRRRGGLRRGTRPRGRPTRPPRSLDELALTIERRARGARGGLGDVRFPARAGRARRPAARDDVRRPGARRPASSRSPTGTSRTAWGGARSRRRAPTASRVTGSDVPARSVTDGLRAYPDDLLSSPLDVREASVSFAPGSGDAVAGDGGAEPASTDDPTRGRRLRRPHRADGPVHGGRGRARLRVRRDPRARSRTRQDVDGGVPRRRRGKVAPRHGGRRRPSR